MFSFTCLLLALAPLPPELEQPRDWVSRLIGDGEVEVVVIIATDRDGEVKRVAVRTSKRHVEVPLARWQHGLIDELKKARNDVKNPDSLRVIADERWYWHQVRDVTKAGKEAGFVEVGFAPWPKR
jgi:hypothetical protein